MDIRAAVSVRLLVALLLALVLAAAAVVAATLWWPSGDSGQPRADRATASPSGQVASPSAQASPSGQVVSPSVPVKPVCGNTSRGPAQAPSGAVAVDPAVDGDLNEKTMANPPGTTFWLRPGRHTLGTDQFGQVIPKDGNTYLGAPGAVLDGQGRNLFAFTQPAREVTVRYLTIRGFMAPHDQGVVNHDSGDGWVVEHNTIEKNAGAALMAGKGQQIRGNCLRDNGQYGFNAYKQGNTITGLVIEDNEIVGNNTGDWERKRPGCGCTGGGKLWAVNGADIRGNWVHDNRGPGLWADVNNNDILIEKNLIEQNDSAAIIYETSYNAIIRDNVIRKNNWVEGKQLADEGDAFPTSAIYLSESGGEPRIPARTDRIDVYGNLLEDNWSGITAWENADRYCNSPANPSDDCTKLVDNRARCARPGIATGALYDDCRWKTQRVSIHHNSFLVDEALVPGCRQSSCARMALLANYGSFPDWSPYLGEKVQQAITLGQGNQWYENTYRGEWKFVAHGVEKVLSAKDWRADPYVQDRRSTFS